LISPVDAILHLKQFRISIIYLEKTRDLQARRSLTGSTYMYRRGLTSGFLGKLGNNY